VVPELLAERAQSHGDRLFVACEGETRTFGQMQERAERLAGGLASLGVTKGDRVASILPNCIEHVELIFACARLGALHVPTNVFLKGEFLRYQLADAGPRIVVADAEGISAVEAIRGELPDLEHLVACQEMPEDSAPQSPALEAGDTMAIIYTSGTTGMPKGCRLPHGYHTRSPESGQSLLNYSSKDILYTALPLFHGWARGMLMAALNWGLELHLDAEFSAAGAVKRWQDTNATVFSGVGAMGMALLAIPPSEVDRSHHLRVAFMIPFPPDSQAAFTKRFGARVQSQMYGQTETGAITFAPLDGKSKPATVGRASPQYEVRVVDDDDRRLPPERVGEVVVRPLIEDMLYTGYWRKPKESAEAMRGGWHHTGDLGRMDAQGWLTFVDRKKDALRRRGENIASVQLETAIARHPKIAEAAVVAVPSPLTEDEIKAFLVLEDGQSVEPEELFEFFSETLPYFAIPRYVQIVEGLPKTATMRVQKNVLRLEGLTKDTWDLEAMGLTVERQGRR
jgi:carnitine-CoA ligase